MGDRMTKLLGTATNSRAPHPWTDRPDEEIEWMRAHARGLRRHENMAKWAAKYERIVCHIENIEAEVKELRERFLFCAVEDVLMNGTRLQGWKRSELERLYERESAKRKGEP